MSFLPYGRQTIDQDDIDAVIRALRGEKITQGPLVDAFESDLAKYSGAKHVSVVGTGTAALHLAYAGLGLGAGDEIITSPITFLATANAARYVGANVRFCDVDPRTGNMLPSSLEALISPRTRGIVPVHLGGLPTDMKEIADIARRRGLWVVEDASHALGATYGATRTGDCTYSAATVFSFHPVKHVTTGEGGAICTSDATLDRKCRQLRHHGIGSPAGAFSDPWYYEADALGFNYRITDIQCALGISQLKKQPAWIERRRAIATLYRRLIKQKLGDAVDFQREFPDRESAYHLFPIFVDFEKVGVSRAHLMVRLKEQGVGSQVHYIPVDSQPYFRSLYGEPAQNPGVAAYYSRELSLPMFPAMTDADVGHVVNALSAALTTPNNSGGGS